LDEKKLSEIAVSPRTYGEVQDQRQRQRETDVQEDVVPSGLWVRHMARRVSTQQDQGRAHISKATSADRCFGRNAALLLDDDLSRLRVAMWDDPPLVAQAILDFASRHQGQQTIRRFPA
jgi:hypothetical protein